MACLGFSWAALQTQVLQDLSNNKKLPKHAMNKTYYIGLDVHKDSIAIAYALEGSREDPSYYGECGGSILAAERTLRKLAKLLNQKLQDLKICYEAGPTGFILARRLRQLKVDCVLMAPSKTERKPNEVIKTDKRDAMLIAKLFRNGDITPCLLYTSPSPRDQRGSRMPSSA